MTEVIVRLNFVLFHQKTCLSKIPHVFEHPLLCFIFQQVNNKKKRITNIGPIYIFLGPKKILDPEQNKLRHIEVRS
jgi:hypothetical protein